MTEPRPPIPAELPPALVPGRGGLPLVMLSTADGAEAEIYLHGAHVTRWVPAGGGESRLFLSERSDFDRSAAIRGGVPVVFPQFSERGPLEKHGFARISEWALAEVEREETGGIRAVFRLTDTDETRERWPHSFIAEMTVVLDGATLQLALTVTNTGSDPFSFTAAFHPYFQVADIAEATVVGLRGARYEDAAAGNTVGIEEREEISIRGEFDRIFFDAPRELQLREPTRMLHIARDGFSDVVVWNPGPEGTAGRRDFASGDERRMLCVEAAALGTPITLTPGAQWTGSQTITAG